MLAFLDIHSHLSHLPILKRITVKMIAVANIEITAVQSFLIGVVKKYLREFAKIYSWKALCFVAWLFTNLLMYAG